MLLHQLLGEHVAAYVLLVVYESFSTLVSIAFVAAVVLSRTASGTAAVFIASMVWVWILGVATYYAIPSLGPFWSAPQEFAGLPHTMVQDTQAKYLGQRADLLAHPHAAGAFAQVSAFASLHVGVTFVIVLMASLLRAAAYDARAGGVPRAAPSSPPSTWAGTSRSTTWRAWPSGGSACGWGGGSSSPRRNACA